MNAFLEYVRQLPDGFSASFTDLFTHYSSTPAFEAVSEVYTLLTRWILPILAIFIFFRCIIPLFQNRKTKEAYGYLYMINGTRIPVYSWENLIGRSRFADIVINLPIISRSHAVLTYYKGNWTISDLGSKGGVQINDKIIEQPQKVNYGDTISLAGVQLSLQPAETEPVASVQPDDSTDAVRSGKGFRPGLTLLLLILFQLLSSTQIYFSQKAGAHPAIPVTFLFFITAECIHYGILRRCSRKKTELELLCYFLCGASLLIVAAAAPGSLYKQLAAIIMGAVVYTIVGITTHNLERAQKFKYTVIASGAILLVLNLAIGETYFGARNWINLGFITFQPMEFVKIAFVLAGTARLDRLLTTRNMTLFIAFSGACFLTLVLIRDFGTAVVFFFAFIVIAFMHSGDIRTLALVTSGAVFGGFAVLSFMPYIAARFSAWGNVWQYANTSGYQQTRTMIAAASGGLLGVGGGEGYLVNVAAADTDLVFGIICEEWGLLIAFTVVLIIVVFALYAVHLTMNCRSSFYAIAACGAATIFLLQATLNVLGSVDILPLTGVTIPFVSNGGTSMIASWGLLALIKSAE